MTTRTSAEAYSRAKEDGIIFRTRQQIWDVLNKKGPMTAHECWHEIRGWLALEGRARINGVTPRFSEMEYDGVVTRLEPRACRVTGENCYVWQLTGLPANHRVKKLAEPTKKELINVLCEQLEEIFVRIKPETDKGKIWVNRTKAVLEQCAKYRKQKRKVNEAN